MQENKILKLELCMSPRAIDELKNITALTGVSKYQIPLVLFPDDIPFEIKAAVTDGQTVQLGFVIDNKNITLSGSMEHSKFFCRSVSDEKIEGLDFTLYFTQEKSEDFVYISESVKKRLAVWYDYIESLVKKAENSSHIFFCKGASVSNGKINISTYDLKAGTDIKNLTVGFLDDNNRPSWGFGNAERLENEILTVKPFADDTISIMRELSSGIRLIAYDGAADITCKRMKLGLDKLCKGEAVNKKLTDFLFDPKKANRNLGGNIILNEENLLSENMNSEQISAVEGALNAEDLYLIQGPPGTGKTTVIAEICYQNAIRGLKTLIVSQSNLAVDNAISRVMKCSDIRVLRKGDISRVEEEGIPFIEDNVVGTWISQIAGESAAMDEKITENINSLRDYRAKLSEILSYAENAVELSKKKLDNESQLYFYTGVFEEARKRRNEFFELIAQAYETDNIEYAEAARDVYPPDFKIPNEIYNNVLKHYLDIKADSELLHQYEFELGFLNEYTEKFTEHFNIILKTVSRFQLDKAVYNSVFYHADINMVESLYNEGCGILNSRPKGFKTFIFGYKWRKRLAGYYRRVENLMVGIQQKTIRLAERIHKIRNDMDFMDNVQSFHLALDALGEDFDTQYYIIKSKCEKLYHEASDSAREYSYAVECFKEKITDDFYSAALKNINFDNISLEQIEYNVNKYYQIKFSRYDTWKKILAQWRKAVSSSGNSGYASLKKLYIKNANVIGITCIQSGTKDFNENYPSFDVVIIDEASKSTPPDIILPMLKGKKVILVGDHKQLPPFIDSTAYDELEEENTEYKELVKVSLFEELYEKSESVMRTMLSRQYRMHRDIAALINQFYIDTDAGRLESPASEFKKHCCQGIEINEDNHVLWYDIPNKSGFYEKKNNKSFYNEYEVETVKKILSVIEKNLSENNQHKSVGVITFYDAQVRLLEDEIINSGFCRRFGHFSLRVGSVDKFQGMEEDIIIVSFVRNNPDHLIGFAKDSRRINVAMSRAKDLLIIAGCSENFINSSNTEASQMFRNIYNITSKLQGVKQAADIPYIKLEDKNYNPCRTTEIYKSVLHEEQVYIEGELNILDVFILKAAYEFKGKTLSDKNISNALGIALLFVEERLKYLREKDYVLYKNNLVKINEKGENALVMCGNSYSM